MKNDHYNRNKIFFKHLRSLLMLVLLPLVILSSLSIFITQRYIKEEVNKNNNLLLVQASQKFDLIINELDTLSLNVSVNPYTIVTLKHIFNQPNLTYEDMKLLTTIKSFIESQSHVKPYVHSIYIYYANDNDRLISSADMGLADMKTHYDKGWFASYIHNRANTGIWSELREIQTDSFSPKKSILSIYKNLFMNGFSESEGVIVLNIKLDYLTELLDSAVGYPYQGLVIVNENKLPLIFFNTPSGVKQEYISNFLNNNAGFFTYTLGEQKYTISKYVSPQYGWTYLSVMPNSNLYEVPTRLMQISLAIFAAVLLLGISLSIYMTRNNLFNFNKLVRIIESAKSGGPTPFAVSRVKDEYSYIIQNVVKSFIEQDYLKMQLSERKYKMKVLELLALQSQINPHFLYNTLHTISWKSIALTRKPNEISEMIENLSTILKYSLSDSTQTVSLQEEIYSTKCYLSIQFVRYRNKFIVKWNLADQIDDIRTMKLFLQPLIENSIYHGIKQKEGSGHISIRMLRDGRYLKIWITDDGVGIETRQLKELQSMLKKEAYSDKIKSDHIGLFNVKKRLALLYGEDFCFKIKSVRGRGTSIFVRFPTNYK